MELFFDTDDYELLMDETTGKKYVKVSIEEFNGLKKALGIIHDRSLQKIEQSHEDENGYQCLKASLRDLKEVGEKCWYVTYRTPYSLKMKPSELRPVILNDLIKYYDYVDGEPKDILYIAGLLRKGIIPTRLSSEQNRLYGKMKEKQAITFRLNEFFYNIKLGRYEIALYERNIYDEVAEYM